MRPEILQRIVLAKSLLNSAITFCSNVNDEFAFAKGILLLHDAAEATLGALADHLSARVKDKTYLLEYPDLIKNSDPQKRNVPYQTQLRNLNALRVNIKHLGLFPNPKKESHFPITVKALIEEIAKDYFDLNFEAISLKALISNETVRNLVNRAEEEIAAEQYEASLITLGYAMYYISLQYAMAYAKIPAGDRDEEIDLSDLDPDEKLRFLSKGVDPTLFDTFLNLTPQLFIKARTTEIFHKWGREFGHPANWTKRNASFCLEFCVDTALKFQKNEPYELLRYSDVYEDVLAPVGEKAIFLDRGENPPKPVFTLNKGEKIRGQVYSYDSDKEYWLVHSDDLPLTGRYGSRSAYVAKSDIQVKTEIKKRNERD